MVPEKVANWQLFGTLLLWLISMLYLISDLIFSLLLGGQVFQASKTTGFIKKCFSV